MTTNGLDYAKTLMRTVARAFFSVEQVVVIDALIIHSALHIQDFCIIFDSKLPKNIQKYIGPLKEAGLVAIATRQEYRDASAQKASSRDYYYIDYRKAIDAIKYKIYMVDSRIKKDVAPTKEKKELDCPRCHAQWTLLEVADCFDPGSASGFACKRCGEHLDAIDVEDAPEKDDTPARFNRQFGKILDLLQQIDSTVVPEVTGIQAINTSKPIPKADASGAPITQQQVKVEDAARPEAVRGMKTGPEKINVSLTTESETSAENYRAEQDRKAKLAEKNALPDWHSKSTITGTAIRDDAVKNDADANGNGGGLSFNDMDEDKKKDAVTAVEDEYFKQLEEEQRLQAQKADDEEEEESDDEFEDVAFAPPVAPVKDEGEPAAKRAKVDEPAAAPAKAESKADDEESDEDFEDAL